MSDVATAARAVNDSTDWDDARVQALAMLRSPSNILQLKNNPSEAVRVYRKAIEISPDDLLALFRVARASETPECWAELVDYAIRSGKCDKLMYFFVRYRRVWHGDMRRFGIHFRRLAANLGRESAKHLIRACNPKNRLWISRHVDFDVLWSIVVCGQLERRDYRRALDAVLSAGRGYLVDRSDPKYVYLPHRIKVFYTEVKDWRLNDHLMWRTYGRAQDIRPLVRAVWEANVSAGVLPKEHRYGSEGRRVVPIKAINRDGSSSLDSVKALPFAGLIARFATFSKLRRLYDNVFTLGPDLDGATLSEEGAMLQDLVIHYYVPYLQPMRSNRQKR